MQVTTILGYVIAIGSLIQQYFQAGHDITDWKTWIFPVLAIVTGHTVQDSTTITK